MGCMHRDGSRLRRTGAGLGLLLLCGAVLRFGSCGEANPQPSPGSPNPTGGGNQNPPPLVAALDGSRIFASGLAPDALSGPVLVAGLAETVTANGAVALRLRVAALDFDATVGIEADGGFGARFDALPGAGVELTLTPPDDPTRLLDGFSFTIPLSAGGGDGRQDPWAWADEDRNSAEPPPGAEPSEGASGGFAGGEAFDDINVTAPDERGLVFVYGGYLSVTPGARVVLFLTASGSRHVVDADPYGMFEIEIPAESGAEVLLFATLSDDAGLATGLVTLVVP